MFVVECSVVFCSKFLVGFVKKMVDMVISLGKKEKETCEGNYKESARKTRISKEIKESERKQEIGQKNISKICPSSGGCIQIE